VLSGAANPLTHQPFAIPSSFENTIVRGPNIGRRGRRHQSCVVPHLYRRS
jgi:hypothetical protein